MVSSERQKHLHETMARLGIVESDLVEKFVKGTGHGGQKINKTSSCVYLKHLPSGIEIKCQRDRSQAVNRFLARLELCDQISDRIARANQGRARAAARRRARNRKPSRASNERRLRTKKHRSDVKSKRRRPDS